ncbi:MAG: hypothetical protein ACRC3I_03275 [Cetobacterium sp.]
MKHYIKLLLCFFLIGKLALAEEYNLEDLNQLRDMGAISKEDYELIKKDLGRTQGTGIDGLGLYTLKLNSRTVSNTYPIYIENRVKYFNITAFFELIEFKNYKQSEKQLVAQLGYNLDKLEMKSDNNQEVVIFKDKKYDSQNTMIKILEGEFYLEEELFNKIFTSFLEIDEQKLIVETYLNFTLPSDILTLLDNKNTKLKKSEEINEIIYNGERKLFELGYTKVYLGKEFTKSKDSDWKSDWKSDIEYQGALLYGQLTAAYDVKEEKLGLVELEYSNIYKNHTFEIQNRNNGNDRTWALNFYKDKGFYEYGQRVIIKEKVPIGSRVELVYLGTAIAIEDEENGEVIFENNIIRSDRTYILKIYTPDGKIIEKEINTSRDYNQQEYGELEYSFFIEENKVNNSYPMKADLFYGITEKITLGVGYRKEAYLEQAGKKYLDSSEIEIIYGENLNGYSYTLKSTFGQTWNNFKDSKGKSLNKKNNYSLLGDLKFGDYRFLLGHERFGEFYNEKHSTEAEIEYSLLKNLRTKYRYDTSKTYEGESKNESRIEINGEHSFKTVLVYFDSYFYLDRTDEDSYSVSLFHNGMTNITTKLEHRWTESGKNYETGLTLFNNNFRGLFDYNVELKYSKKQKELITFGITLDIDDWFKIDFDGNNRGNRVINAGIDKVFDLKNLKHKISDTDVSRINVTTFIDANLNDKFDLNEEIIGDVEVEIAQQKITTNEKGKATFYGVSNKVVHNLNPNIKDPYYTLGKSKVKAQSYFSTTVEAHIPLKPLIHLTGAATTEGLNFTSDELEFFYSDIVIEIQDKLGRNIDIVSLDDTGIFDISDLMPGKYKIIASYVGENYKITPLEKEVDFIYKKGKVEYNFDLKITDKEILYLENN